MEHLPYLVTFARVVQAGSFVAGAQRLKLAPSVASKHISKLEEHLGARLLNRSTRKLSLTEAGTAFYEHAARIVEELDQSEHAVQRLQTEPSGRLKVSTLNSFANAVLAPLLPEFMRRHPKVVLEIVCNDRLVDLTEEGYDLALRITSAPAPHLVARKLADIRFQIYAAPAYLERNGTPTSTADLAKHRCLGYPATLGASVAWRFRHEGREVAAPIQPAFEINSVESLRLLAVSGEGLAVLPTYAVGNELRSGSLVAVMADYRGFSESTAYAVYLPNRYGSPKLRAFVEFLLEKLGPQPPWEATGAITPARARRAETA
ncbi:MAG TPA: LysR substrate-binding domain-containing protein [Verrucomicrobiae bacterium]|nr:LysR substrate-binding domain-containing protein [Verrucomicrobiae bacterium]